MNTKMNPVVIIGCGPAACGMSLFLTKNKIYHTILEKETFPRDKVCGDACSGKTVSVLNKANPQILEEIFLHRDFLPCNGVVFSSPNGKLLNTPFRGKAYSRQLSGFIVKREVFDYFLFQKIQSQYCTVIQNVNVRDIEKKETGYLIKYTDKNTGSDNQIETNLLVGADGDKGIARKKLLNQDTVVKTSWVGLRAYYEGVADMHEKNYIELHFLNESLPGYFWIFPMAGGLANVGIGMDSTAIRHKKINLTSLMLQVIQENKLIKDRFKNARLTGKITGWGLPMSNGKGRISGEGFMLVGDAASLIDPFTGEGIGNALFSGMMAAEAARKALENQRFDAGFLNENYDGPLYKRIGRELKLSDTMQRMVRYPWLFNFIFNKAHKSPTLQHTISNMLADLDLREELKKPSFYLKILFNR